MNYYYEKARARLGYLKTDVPVLIKGVRGTSSENHDLENLSKGILRAKYNLCVNKDGTVRQLWEIMNNGTAVNVAFDGLYKKLE